MATDNKHVTWIDCLKGIGILSVVFAHVTDIKALRLCLLDSITLPCGLRSHAVFSAGRLGNLKFIRLER